MVTTKATWTGLAVLLLVMMLIAVALFYWHHVTGASMTHLLAFIPQPGVGQGC